ncbi:MAG: Co2+/Mg2+ efflux protein ApaG [Gemmatimonadetes bacterium]|nr:Co2+/Mg2+ efflux protein ApaG [Gemmatimonadota bacterium]
MGYQETSHGIRVTVQPAYLVGESSPSQGRYVFAYLVRLDNLTRETAQLRFRHWFIHDSAGEETEVEGEGVVGEQPVLAPGGSHEYNSFCILKSPAGYMEGHYTFFRPDGTKFEVKIPRFELRAPLISTGDQFH